MLTFEQACEKLEKRIGLPAKVIEWKIGERESDNWGNVDGFNIHLDIFIDGRIESYQEDQSIISLSTDEEKLIKLISVGDRGKYAGFYFENDELSDFIEEFLLDEWLIDEIDKKF